MELDEILSYAPDTKAIKICDGAIAGTPDMFRQLFNGKRPVIIADPITWRIAGEQLQNLFISEGICPEKPFIFNDPDFHAEWSFVEQLDASLSETDAIPVAVGVGTINDITKLSSAHTGRQYMAVGTAASMDGYTAYGASIIKDGVKQSFSCRAPLGFIADLDIISQAPKKITAGGYADLFAKVTAGADWILADALGIEPIDPVSFNIVQKGLKIALSDPVGLHNGDRTALYHLMEGLLLGGIAMQIHKSSRPTSGAEHLLSHLWNMENHHMVDGSVPSHGFQVAIGTLASTALYEQMFSEDFPSISNWLEIRDKLKHQLIPYNQLRDSLEAVGAPTHPEQIGISRERLIQSIPRARRIRPRFTIFDIALDSGNFNKWALNLFPSTPLVSR